MAGYQYIETQDVGDVVVVRYRVKKILDESLIEGIGAELFHLADELRRRKILIDYTGLQFQSSTFLGKLMMLHRKLLAVQGKLVLSAIPTDIFDTFRITKLNVILSCASDLQAGLRLF